MRKIVDSLSLIRVVNCLLAMIGVLVGARLTEAPPAYFGPFMSAVAAFLVCASGNIVNDLVDVESDRINHPRRVLVRGALTRQFAIVLALILNGAALACALLVGQEITVVVGMAIIVLLAYNFRLKRTLIAGNITVALLGGLTFLTGGFAVDPGRTLVLPGPIIPACFAFLFHLIREIVKDSEDLDGDRQIWKQSNRAGRSLPMAVGVKNSLAICVLLFLLLAALTLVPVIEGWYAGQYGLIVIYFMDIPLLLLLLYIWHRPNRRWLRLGSISLKAGMALGTVALLWS